MKKLFTIIASLAYFFASQAQTVGIGTPTPDNKAVLDIVSTNKGVLIPRIVDTANVPDPVEGLIIYNKKTKTPYYYNGKQWLPMGGNLPVTLSSPTDRITYIVTGTGFSTTEEPVFTLTQGIDNMPTVIGNVITSRPDFPDFNFTKASDINSKRFNQAGVSWTILPSIELKVYAAGATDPYISYRLKNIVITSVRANWASGDGSFIESVSFIFDNYGFKDWVNNTSFGFNIKTGALSAY